MKKTITANISGIVFHIDEDAYEVLSAYLTKIRSYFNHTEGAEEIIADIELRIAELFTERLNEHKNVINIADVEHVVEIMGAPEQYVDEEDLQHEHEETPPAQRGAPEQKRRIFRDPDNRIIGGVCSGVAAYFGWDTTGVRIAFALLFLLLGSGLFLYIILWILIPKARTTAEKLQMRGERVNVDSIHRNWTDRVREESSEISKRVGEMDTDYHVDRVKNAVNKTGNAAKVFFKGLTRVFGLFLILGSVCAIFFAILFLTGTDVFITFSDDHNVTELSYGELSEIIFTTPGMATLALFTIIIGLAIPLIYALIAGIKLTFRIEGSIRSAGIFAVVLMIAATGMGFFVGVDTIKQYGQDTRITDYLPFEESQADTLYLELIPDETFSSDFKDHHEYFFELISVGEQEVTMGNAFLDVVPSYTDSVEVVAILQSHGPTQKEAIRLARNINYQYIQKDNATLAFSPNFTFDKEDRFRGQQVRFEVRIPEGKAVRFGPKLDRIIYDIKNETNTRDRKMVGLTWTMRNGELECVGCRL